MSFEMPAIIHDRVFVLPEDESLELLGRLQYDDQGIDPREVRVELELSDELEELGARVEVEGYSRRDHHFPHSGVLRYGLRIPLGALEGVAGVLGQVQLYRLMSATEGDRRLEGRAEVRVGQVMRIGDLPPYPHEWVIDQGGHSTLVVSEHGVEGVVALAGTPVLSQLGVVGPESEPVERRLVLAEDGPEGTRRIRYLKNHLEKDRAVEGPAAASPMSWTELDVEYLTQVLRRVIREMARREGDTPRLPREIVATVPTTWTTQKVEAYRQILHDAFARLGVELDPERVEVLDEATAGGIGVLQQAVEDAGAAAARFVLADAPGEPLGYCTLDIGATTTDVSLATLTIVERDTPSLDGSPRFVATSQLLGVAGIPVGGDGYTRLIVLVLVARLALSSPILGEQTPEVREDLERLAKGEIAHLEDPFLTGFQVSHQAFGVENPRSRRLLAALAKLIPPSWDAAQAHTEWAEMAAAPDAFRFFLTAREGLVAMAEELKVALNTANAEGVYPERVEGDTRSWEQLLAFYAGAQRGVAGSGPEWDVTTQAELFRPAIELTLHMLGDMCRTADRPVSLICLTGKGGMLREFHSPQPEANAFARSLPPEVFSFHPSRVLRTHDPKLAVAKGGYTATHGQAMDSDWVWECDNLFRVLPYDIGRLSVDKRFERIVPRGTPLPHRESLDEGDQERRPRRLDLFQRAYPGAPLKALGTLDLEGDEPPALVVDEDRRITNQDGTGITPPASEPQPLNSTLPAEGAASW